LDNLAQPIEHLLFERVPAPRVACLKNDVTAAGAVYDHRQPHAGLFHLKWNLDLRAGLVSARWSGGIGGGQRCGHYRSPMLVTTMSTPAGSPRTSMRPRSPTRDTRA